MSKFSKNKQKVSNIEDVMKRTKYKLLFTVLILICLFILFLSILWKINQDH